MLNYNYQSINNIDFNQETIDETNNQINNQTNNQTNNQINNQTNNQTYIWIISKFIFDFIIFYSRFVEIIIFYLIMINVLYNYTQTKYNNNILFSEFSIFYYTVYHFITQITIKKENNELNNQYSNEVKKFIDENFILIEDDSNIDKIIDVYIIFDIITFCFLIYFLIYMINIDSGLYYFFVLVIFNRFLKIIKNSITNYPYIIIYEKRHKYYKKRNILSTYQ
jgi:hypothetical protein